MIQEAPCCRRAELQAMVLLNGTGSLGDGRVGLTVQTENVATARRIYTLLRELFDLHPEVLVRKKMRLKKNNVYAVRVPNGAEAVWTSLGLAPGDSGGSAWLSWDGRAPVAAGPFCGGRSWPRDRSTIRAAPPIIWRSAVRRPSRRTSSGGG